MSQLLQNALYGSAMILTVAALRRLLKGRLAPEVWLVLWAVCLFRLLTPAAPESALSFYGVPGLLAERPAVSAIASAAASDGDAADVTSPVTVGAPDTGSAGTETAAPAPVRPSLDWAAVLWGMWLLGAAVAGVRYGLLWLRTWRGVNGAILLPPDDPRYAPLPRRVRLRVAPIEGAPLTFGVVRPTVVLPPELNNGALACVLAHEGVHAKRRDNLWHYVMAAALTVFWWNPAVWLMAKLLRRDVELSCDRAALKKLGPARRAEYARVLLNLSTQAGGPAFCQTFGPKEAEERILFVVKYKKMSICSIILALALVCLITTAFATNPMPTPIEEPTPDITVKELEALWEQVIQEEIRTTLLEHYGSLNGVSAQSDCLHINTIPGGTSYIYIPFFSSQHEYIVEINKYCTDCGKLILVSRTVTDEDHTFGAGEYTGANHSASNYKMHYYTCEHTCILCNATYSYTRSAACTANGCIDIASVGDEDAQMFAVEDGDVLDFELGSGVAYYQDLDGNLIRLGQDSTLSPLPEAESAAPVTPTAPAAPAASSAAPAANYTWQQMTITSTPHHDETHHEETHNSETHHSGGHHH